MATKKYFLLITFRSHKTVGIKVFLTIFAWWQKDPEPLRLRILLFSSVTFKMAIKNYIFLLITFEVTKTGGIKVFLLFLLDERRIRSWIQNWIQKAQNTYGSYGAGSGSGSATLMISLFAFSRYSCTARLQVWECLLCSFAYNPAWSPTCDYCASPRSVQKAKNHWDRRGLLVLRPVLRIWIHWIRIRIRSSILAGNDPDPMFLWPKIYKNVQQKNKFWLKFAIYVSLGFPKGRPSNRRSLQSSKEEHPAFQTWNF